MGDLGLRLKPASCGSFAEMGSSVLRPYGDSASEAAEEFVEFVGGVEVGFELAGV
jgi:hypothetical protein